MRRGMEQYKDVRSKLIDRIDILLTNINCRRITLVADAARTSLASLDSILGMTSDIATTRRASIHIFSHQILSVNVTATNYVYLNPVFTLITAAIFLGERMSPVSILGCAAILAGVILAGRR